MANSFLTTIQHDLLVQSIGYTSTKSCHPHDEDEEMYVFKTQEQEKEECKVSQITFAKKFITEQDIAHLLLEENEEQAMADAFSEESDMFKNTALQSLQQKLAHSSSIAMVLQLGLAIVLLYSYVCEDRHLIQKGLLSCQVYCQLLA